MAESLHDLTTETASVMMHLKVVVPTLLRNLRNWSRRTLLQAFGDILDLFQMPLNNLRTVTLLNANYMYMYVLPVLHTADRVRQSKQFTKPFGKTHHEHSIVLSV